MSLEQIRRSPTESHRFALNFHSRIQGIPENLGTLKSPSATLEGRKDCAPSAKESQRECWSQVTQKQLHRNTGRKEWPTGRCHPLEIRWVASMAYVCVPTENHSEFTVLHWLLRTGKKMFTLKQRCIKGLLKQILYLSHKYLGHFQQKFWVGSKGKLNFLTFI